MSFFSFFKWSLRSFKSSLSIKMFQHHLLLKTLKLNYLWQNEAESSLMWCLEGLFFLQWWAIVWFWENSQLKVCREGNFEERRLDCLKMGRKSTDQGNKSRNFFKNPFIFFYILIWKLWWWSKYLNQIQTRA